MSLIISDYSVFLPEHQIHDFECDLENGKYQKWVEKYPQHTMPIFCSLIAFNGNYLNEEDIIYFMNKKIDLNTQIEDCIYMTSVMHYACEMRFRYLIEYLIKYGADLNAKEQKRNRLTPLETVLMGHSIYDLSRVEETEDCVRVLIQAGAKRELKKWIVVECCEEFLEKSEYLKDIITSCTIE